MSEFPAMSDKVLAITSETLSEVLNEQGYASSKCADWIEQISNDILDKLRNLSPNFKYIVNCMIIQKIGAGLHYESVAHWDEKTDASFTSKFESESLLCLCTVTGVAI